MHSYKICIVTYDEEPWPSVLAIARDDLLAKALNALDVEVDAHPWTKADIDWEKYDLLLIRSTWDYHQKYSEFLNWLQSKKHLPLCHSAEAMTWVTDKKVYLQHFMQQGTSVPDTVFIAKTVEEPQKESLKDVMVSKKWKTAIVKPRVGGDAVNVYKLNDINHAEVFQYKFEQLIMQTDYMVQEFIAEISEGEWSLVFFEGMYSHAVKQSQGETFERNKQKWSRESPPASMLEFALKVVKAVPFDTVCARVDLVRKKSGEFVLMEFELIGTLYLKDETAEIFAGTIHKLLCKSK